MGMMWQVNLGDSYTNKGFTQVTFNQSAGRRQLSKPSGFNGGCRVLLRLDP